MSTLPEMVWDKLVGGTPVWLVFAKMGLLLTFVLASPFWRPLRQLLNYNIVLFVFIGLTELRPLINFTLPFVQVAFGASAFDVRMQSEQTGKLAVAFAMIATLLLLGYNRRDFFLTLGDLRAPIEPVPLLGFSKPDPWTWFGCQWAIYIATALAALLYFGMRPSGELLLKVVPILPSILFYAALNAFNEEITYRAPMLATLESVSGSKHALWMSAYFFGIAHYFGTPGGIIGGIASMFMGWILGKGMVETRGLIWSW